MRFVSMNWSPGYLNVCPQHTDIEVKCTCCGEQKPFDRHTVPPLFRHALIEDIEPRLRCSSCGAKAAKMLFGSYVDDAAGTNRLLSR
ncbi:hypothetical protein ASC97_04380 [Rhizobium sp. Root1203]|uniref:hypothetical protein n=1 Tax=Rhizobium sp. Root1203 TaxID=1736427 RepID=UPI000708C8B2|nr:hypothetical protein [Rhizobium sp. Root1203]KQV27619.1 hypothetical protein ASC97_04380 [Rhizobium sp. Root1203]